MFQEYNPNPAGRRVGDCAVRAVAKALDIDWETAYAKIVKNGFLMADMPASDSVWGAVLRANGFSRKALPDTCPMCYTAEMFCEDHPKGTFVLGFGGHVATVQDGVLYDSWDSSNEIPAYYFTPAAVDEYGNVTSTAIITVPRGCCFSLSVRAVSAVAPTETPAPTINVQNANLVINRVA